MMLRGTDGGREGRRERRLGWGLFWVRSPGMEKR